MAESDLDEKHNAYTRDLEKEAAVAASNTGAAAGVAAAPLTNAATPGSSIDDEIVPQTANLITKDHAAPDPLARAKMLMWMAINTVATVFIVSEHAQYCPLHGENGASKDET